MDIEVGSGMHRELTDKFLAKVLLHMKPKEQ